jgi:hypothetical protein
VLPGEMIIPDIPIKNIALKNALSRIKIDTALPADNISSGIQSKMKQEYEEEYQDKE